MRESASVCSMTPEEARRRILEEDDQDLEGFTIEGTLDLGEAIIRGILDLGEVTIEGGLNLEGATIGSCLNLEGAIIEGTLNLSTKSGPTRIFVTPGLAQLVHWSAPTIPLVVVKK